MRKNIEDLILFPFGGNSREALDVIERVNALETRYQVISIVDDNLSNVPLPYYQGIKLTSRQVFEQQPNAKVLAVQANPKNYFKRLEIIDSLQLPQSRFISAIHPSAQISFTAKIGTNVLIMAGVVISRDVVIEDDVIILPNSVISHDSHIKRGCFIGSNVSISGNIKVGTCCYIGSGAKIINDCSIADYTLVGLGAVVIKSIEQRGHYAGIPARII